MLSKLDGKRRYRNIVLNPTVNLFVAIMYILMRRDNNNIEIFSSYEYVLENLTPHSNALRSLGCSSALTL